MAKFILVDPAITHSFDTEEEAVAFLKKRCEGSAEGYDRLSLAAIQPESQMLVVKAEVVRKVYATLGTGPGGDGHWRDLEAERKATLEKELAGGYYGGKGDPAMLDAQTQAGFTEGAFGYGHAAINRQFRRD